MYWTTGSGRIELNITKKQAKQGSHPGPCDQDIKELSEIPAIKRQLAKIDEDLLRHELSEYGAWDESELADHAANLERILWLACGDIVDRETTKETADDRREEREKAIKEKLSHGSGIDGEWKVEDKGSYFKAENFFHCMNDAGYYNGYADFSLIIPKSSPGDFRLHFHGRTSQYKNRRYQLREYLEDTFYHDLTRGD